MRLGGILGALASFLGGLGGILRAPEGLKMVLDALYQRLGSYKKASGRLRMGFLRILEGLERPQEAKNELPVVKMSCSNVREARRTGAEPL